MRSNTIPVTNDIINATEMGLLRNCQTVIPSQVPKAHNGFANIGCANGLFFSTGLESLWEAGWHFLHSPLLSISSLHVGHFMVTIILQQC